ncbi:MAG: hypothetical protein AB1424_05160 [Thermodesulfobacteriota bacterium]
MKYLWLSHPVRGFLSRSLFPWRLSFILPPFLLLVIFMAFSPSGSASRAFAEVIITVDAAQNQGYINPLVFGQNVLFDSNTMWDQRKDTLIDKPDDNNVNVRSMIEDLAPTILRFPGGIGSDVHIWEDGLGIQINNQLLSGDTEISLTDSPQSWRLPNNPNNPYRLKGLLLDPAGINPFTENLSGQLGDRFDYTGVDLVNNKLTGVTDITEDHSLGAKVRIGGRPILGRPNIDPPRDDISQYNNWTNTYGIIEHLKLVNSLGAQSLLTVNFSTGLDINGRISTDASLSQRLMRAQALVAFCNGSTSDTRTLGTDNEGRDWKTVGYWAGQRTAIGYPEPFGVLYWEVGNELFFRSETGHTTANDYANKFKQFAQQMKYIDPQIKVGAVGHSLPTYKGDDDPGDHEPYPVPWNETVITNTINDLDFLVIHTYYPTIYSQMEYASDAWFKLVMAGATQTWHHLWAIKSIIDNINVNYRNIGLAVTEYGIWPYNGQAEHYSSLARALHDADLLMCLIKKEGNATKLGLLAATNWDLHSTTQGAAIGYSWPSFWTNSGSRKIRPQYYALKMLRQNLAGRQLVQTQVSSSPTFSIDAQVGNIDPNPAIPYLEALGALSNDGRRLILVVINRSLDSFPNPTITGTIQLSNLPFTPKFAIVTKLKSTNISDHNEAGEVVKPYGPVTYAPVPPSFDFEPHSLTIIEFRPIQVGGAINLLMLLYDE